MNSSQFLLVAYLVLSLPHITTAAPLGNETDRLALLAFKSKITEDPMGSLSSWNDSIHFCQWHGVTCNNRHQRVAALDVQHQKLGGSISPYLGNLSFLIELLLDNNSFIGEIPPELGRLQRLELLLLRNNSLDGEIPANISSCSNLIEVRLSWNMLVGNIPLELGSLSKLTLIQAPRNNLTGVVPPSFGNLTSLVFLGFSSNSLIGSLPSALGQLTKLEYIGFSENRLSGIFPPTIFNLSSLTTIFVPLNQIQGSLPPDIGITLPNLSYIAIEGNQFTGTIPISVSNMTNLKYLFLGENRLAGKVPTFENLHELLQIDISGNSLGSGEANDLSFISSLTNASDLTGMGLNSNKFGGMLPDSFGYLSTKLEGLSLGNNLLYGSIPNWLSKFSNFTYIDMSSNQFTGNIPLDIGKLQKLQKLDLSHNRLSGDIPSVIGNLSLLTGLHLDSNNFYGSIPPSLGKYKMLLSLNLSRNNLSGTIPPQIFGLSSLSLYLDLSRNQLAGSLPTEVGNLKNLGELVVAKNMLSGEIPSTVGSCVRLEKLYMEGNFFRGTIPSSFISLRGIEFLDFSSNNLSGQIPEYFGDFDLQYLNISYNNFEGELPAEGIFKNASAISVTGNLMLCGGSPELLLPKCNIKQSTKISSTLIFKVIISVGSGILGVCFLLSFIFLYWFKNTKKGLHSYSERHSLPVVSYDAIFQATDGFCSANVVGVGSFGTVYKGILDGTIVAVKVFNLSTCRASKSFKAECEALRNIRHRNLVKVVTACVAIDRHGNDFKALVYEFMFNGSLEEWLHTNLKENEAHVVSKNLNLVQRLNIAIDVACGLEYLHRYCETTIVHCDLKPGNVLLDSELVGHVSDFGLARFLSTEQTSSIVVRGSIGYNAPEYGMGSVVSTYGDVYSFGILLLEMFTGKRPTDDIFTDGFTLHSFVEAALPDRVTEIADPVLFRESLEPKSIRGTENQSAMRSDKIEDSLIAVFRVGLACSAESAGYRMDIGDVVNELHYIKDSCWKSEPMERNEL